MLQPRSSSDKQTKLFRSELHSPNATQRWAPLYYTLLMLPSLWDLSR